MNDAFIYFDQTNQMCGQWTAHRLDDSFKICCVLTSRDHVTPDFLFAKDA